MNRVATDLLRKAGIAVLAMSAVGCSASNEFETIQSRLNEIHFELLELRKEGPTKQEVEALGAELAEEIAGLRQSHADIDRALTTLAERIGQLEAKLDDTTYRLDKLTLKIEATNQELQEVRNATTIAQQVSPPPPVTPSNPTDPQALYDTAYNDYSRGSFDLAILAFRQYVESNPATELADNAVYWIGECYFSQRKFEKAIEQFDKVLTRYVESDRAPSARLKKGFAFLELGRRDEGLAQLQNVICEHGGTDEARLARQRLDALGIDADCEGA